jgi:hypothetical protein
MSSARIGSEPMPRMRHDAWLGAFVCLIFALAFARNPIAQLPGGVWSPADISQVFSLTRVTDGWRPGNELMSDVWLQMQSWLQFQRDELHAGRIPLWNPWNGNGVPQLANYQCAVLSPFSLPYYVLPFALAVVVASIGKIFCLSFFTFLFLRELRLAFSASILGAVVFAYAGHNIVLIGYPHSGVAALLPAALFLVERIARRSDLVGPARAWWRAATPGLFVGLVAVLVLLQLAGHPETLFFVLLVVSLYSVFRLLAVWRDARGSADTRWNVVVLGGQLVFCGLIAAAIGSLQTLPFFEYLRTSAMLADRTGRQIPLGLRTWSALLFPNLLGNPSTPYYLSAALPRPDYTIATMAYVGGTATFMALSAFLYVARRRAVAFFAGGFALWFVYAYDVAGTGAVWHLVPGLSMAPINRSQIVGAFCIACLAAFTADHLVRNERRRAIAAGVALVVGGTILLLARANAAAVVELTQRYMVGAEKHALLDSGSARHVAAMTWLLVPGILVLAGAWWLPRRSMRAGAVGALALLVYAQSGALLKGYMPLCNRLHFFPVTPAIEAWKAAAGDREVAVLGDDTLPPCSNMVYHLRHPASFDALVIRRYEQLWFAHFGVSTNWMLARRATERGMQLFGIDAVLDADGWLEVDTAFSSVGPNPAAVAGTGELVRGSEVVQTLTGLRDGLDSVRLHFERPAVDPGCTVDVTLEDAASGTPITSARFSTATMQGSAPEEVGATLRFAPIPGSQSKTLRLRASSTDAEPGRAFVLRARTDWDACVRQAIGSPDSPRTHALAAAWKLERDGKPLPGGLDVDLGFADHDFHAEARVGRFILHGFDRATSRYHVAGKARWVVGEERSWSLANDPGFDPLHEVVLEREDGAPDTTSDSREERAVRLVSEIPGHIRLHVDAGAPRWLVLSQPWYPGWTARVNDADGHFADKRIWRANYAFSAVELPATACDVELDYGAPTFRLACKLALGALVIFAGWLFVSARVARPA